MNLSISTIMKNFNNKNIYYSVGAFALSIIAASIILLVSGYSPIEAFSAIFTATFGATNGIIRTLTLATPLIITGCAFVVASKAGLCTMGAEGSIFLGGLASGFIGFTVDGPTAIVVPLAVICGMIAGGMAGLIAGWLKVRFNSNEVISTIMLNYISIGFVSYVVNYLIIEADAVYPRSPRIFENAMLTKLLPKTQLTTAFILALLAAIGLYLLFSKTTLGYKIRAVGLNEDAARVAGINYKRMIVLSMVMSGAIASLAGTSEVLGIQYRVTETISPGYGWDGISVAALSGGNPIGVIFSGIIFGFLKNGGLYLDRTTDIPIDFISIIQACVVIFVASPKLLEQIVVKVKSLYNGLKRR